MIICELVTCILLSSCNSFDSVTKVKIDSNFDQLVIPQNEAEIFAKAVVYMIDLDLERNGLEYLFDIELLNQDYVDCFNKDYLNEFLTNPPTQKFSSNYNITEEEIQFIEYEKNKNFHATLNEHQLSLLDEFNKYCDEYHEVLNYNDEILTKIALDEGITLENLKSMRLSTPLDYDGIVYANEKYSELLRYDCLEMSYELQAFRNNYVNAYPFNYEVDLPWKYKFTTSQYDASLYGFQYQDVTQDFYVILPNEPKQAGALKNKNHLISYTIYNNCIEIIFDAIEIDCYIMSALVYINNGKITDISTYIQSN